MNAGTFSTERPVRFGPSQPLRIGSRALRLACALATALAGTLAGCGGGSSSTDSAAAAGDKALANASGNTTVATTASTVANDTGGAVAGASSLATKALAQINAARAVARNCGTTAYPATTALSWNASLEAAALAQSQYMNSIHTLTHTGAGNSTVGDRVTAAGYVWSGVGENVAVGYATIEAVMQGWLASPGHCANIMNPGFTVVAVALAADSGAGASGQYWTMDLARP